MSLAEQDWPILHAPPRSGTTWFGVLFEKNFGFHYRTKHRNEVHCFKLDKVKQPVMFMFRNIYAWLPSAYRYGRFYMGTKGKTFEQFVLGTDSFQMHSSGVVFDGPVNGWCDCFSVALGYCKTRNILFSYERLLKDYIAVLEDIRVFLNLPKVLKYETSIKETRDKSERPYTEGDVFDDKRINYFVDKEFLGMYTEQMVEYINNIISKKEFVLDTEEKKELIDE